jgi:hypothetical protein
MKNILKLALLTLVFTLFTNVSIAQSTAKEDAMVQTKELKEMAKFEMDKFKPVYEAYVNYNRKLESINKHIDNTTMAYMEAKSKLDEKFKNDMEPILNTEEFKVFLKKEKLN